MKLKNLLITAFTLMLLFSSSHVALAATYNNTDDVIVAPLETEYLDNTDKINQQLSLMGFTENEIEATPEALRKEIASEGGKKIKIEDFNSQPVTTDAYGNQILTNSLGITTQDFSTGKFSMRGYAISKGAVNASEKAYDVYATYNWSSAPINTYTDTLAMAWQSNMTPYGAPYSVNNWRSGAQLFQYNNKIQKQQVQGNSIEVDVIASGNDPQDGYAKQQIRVSKSTTGTAAVELGYAHKLVPGIALAVLNFVNIDFSGASQQEWSDRFNFSY